MKEEKRNIKEWLYWLSLALAIIILYNIVGKLSFVGIWLKNLLGVLTPFLAGILIAYILYLPCRKIETLLKKTKNKKISKKKQKIFQSIRHRHAKLFMKKYAQMLRKKVTTSIASWLKKKRSSRNSMHSAEKVSEMTASTLCTMLSVSFL